MRYEFKCQATFGARVKTLKCVIETTSEDLAFVQACIQFQKQNVNVKMEDIKLVDIVEV